MASSLFAQPGGTFFTALPFLFVATGMLLGYMEGSGTNLGYSKFASGDGSKKLKVPSRTGTFLCYFPSCAVAGVLLVYCVGFLPMLPAVLKSCGASGFASFLEEAVAASDTRLLLVISVVFVHFTKRELECKFIHKFSGYMNVNSMLFISSAYAAICGLLLATQVVSSSLAAPSLDLKWLGLSIFLVGIVGNGYHHWLLANLRKDGDKKYVVPQGGLFGLFVCPHYIFEIVTFLGIALMSQTVVGWSVVMLVLFYLTGRSIASKQWYMKKMDGFPKDRGVLIPGVF